MREKKIKFTVWLSPEILRAAKARATLDGTTVSEVLAAAGKTALIETDRQHTDAKLLAAVERVFTLIQRIDRRRGYDQQVLKEMAGLMAQSFFNHTPAIPDKDKKAALHSGKARFNRFLDALAANLRSSRSILNDLPSGDEPQAQVAVGSGAAASSEQASNGVSSSTAASVAEPSKPKEQTSSPYLENLIPIEPDSDKSAVSETATILPVIPVTAPIKLPPPQPVPTHRPEKPAIAGTRSQWSLFGRQGAR
jgi:hypothetical protein